MGKLEIASLVVAAAGIGVYLRLFFLAKELNKQINRWADVQRGRDREIERMKKKYDALRAAVAAQGDAHHQLVASLYDPELDVDEEE